MTALAWLLPAALALGLLGLCGFLWSLRNGQFEDLEGASWRALDDQAPPPSQAAGPPASSPPAVAPTSAIGN